MSLRDHLTHRAGYGNLPLAARPLLVGRVQGERFAELLGRFSSPEPITFDYSNEAYLVAGEAMRRTTDHSWKTLLAENVLAPLGMDRSTPRMSVARRRAFAHPHTLVDGEIRTRAPKADTNMHAAGGMVATAPDLGRYLRAVINEGRLNGEQVLPAGAVREALAPQIRCDVSLPFDPFDRHAYGLGWFHSTYRGDRLMHHFGGYTGAFSHMSFMPEHDVGVVVLANGASPAGQTVATHIYDLVLGRDPAAFAKKLRKSAAMTRKMQAQDQKEREAWFDGRAEDPQMRPVSAYTGTYEHEWLGTLTVRQRGDTLTATLGPQTSAMRPFQRDVFSLSLNGNGPRYAPEKLTFDIGASSRADRVEWRPMAAGEQAFSFERVE
jgi:CubicO group peptidase (beta-lactamase class C family)